MQQPPDAKSRKAVERAQQRDERWVFKSRVLCLIFKVGKEQGLPLPNDYGVFLGDDRVMALINEGKIVLQQDRLKLTYDGLSTAAIYWEYIYPRIESPLKKYAAS